MRGPALCIVLCVASAAFATGDHNWSEQVRFVCGSPTALVFLVQRDTTNGGMGDDATWAWLTLEVATGKQKRTPFASMSLGRDEALNPVVAVPYKADAGTTAAAFTIAGGCSLMPDEPRRTPRGMGAEDYRFTDGGLELSVRHGLLPEKILKRQLRAAWTTGPGGDEQLAEGPYLRAELAATDKRTVLALSFGTNVESPVAFLAVDSAALRGARSSLYNEVGLELHRAGHHASAIEWFTASGSEIALYNLACAFARLGDATMAVAELESVKDRQKLAAKIAKDSDFDRIRKSPELGGFLKKLGASP